MVIKLLLPSNCVRSICPVCGGPAIMHQKNMLHDDVYDCCAHDCINNCRFFGTLEDAAKGKEKAPE